MDNFLLSDPRILPLVYELITDLRNCMGKIAKLHIICHETIVSTDVNPPVILNDWNHSIAYTIKKIKSGFLGDDDPCQLPSFLEDGEVMEGKNNDN